MDNSDNLGRAVGPRRRRSLFDPRLPFDRYLLVWNAPAEHELRRFDVVRPIHAETILRRLLAQADDDMWDRLFHFYCRATHLHGVPLLQEHYEDIERWLPRQLHGRLARALLLKRKPLEFTGRFAEQVPEEHVEDQGPQDEFTWIEFVVVDQNGHGVSGLSYEVQLPNDRHAEGRLKRDGSAHYDRLEPGEGTFRLQHPQRASSRAQDEQEAQVVLWNAAAVGSKSHLETDWDGCTARVDIDDEDEMGAVMRAVGATDKRPVGLRIATSQGGSDGSSGSTA